MGRDEKTREITWKLRKQNLPAESTTSNTGKSNKIEKGSWVLEVTGDLYTAASAEQQGTLM